MKMLALLLATVLSFPTAYASDVPLKTGEGEAIATLDSTPVLFIVPITRGEPSPVDGRVLDTQSYIAVAQRTAAAEAERDALRRNPAMPTMSVWTVVLCALALGGGVSLGWWAHGKLDR